MALVKIDECEILRALREKSFRAFSMDGGVEIAEKTEAVLFFSGLSEPDRRAVL